MVQNLFWFVELWLHPNHSSSLANTSNHQNHMSTLTFQKKSLDKLFQKAPTSKFKTHNHLIFKFKHRNSWTLKWTQHMLQVQEIHYYKTPRILKFFEPWMFLAPPLSFNVIDDQKVEDVVVIQTLTIPTICQ